MTFNHAISFGNCYNPNHSDYNDISLGVGMETLKDKFVGALIGTFVGDALGMAVEGWTADQIRDRFGELREMQAARLGLGTYTDDTQMMIGIAESVLKLGRVDGVDISYHFVDNFQSSRGYGSGAVRSLRLLSAGMPWDKVSEEVFEGGSYGNGAAMRVAPIGIYYYNDALALRDAAHISCQPTHAHPLAKNAAAIQAYAIALATALNPNGEEVKSTAFVEELKQMLTPGGEPLMEKLDRIPALMATGATEGEVIEMLGNGVEAENSVPAAIYCFLSNTESVEEAVVAAVNLGGDTDTIGAMTGAIAGAFHGFRSFPPRWVKALENGEKGRDYVIKLGLNLCDLKKKS